MDEPAYLTQTHQQIELLRTSITEKIYFNVPPMSLSFIVREGERKDVRSHVCFTVNWSNTLPFFYWVLGIFIQKSISV